MDAMPGQVPVRPPARLLCACDLPALIADDDGRGRVVDIRQFCKDWAVSGQERRLKMIADAPRPVHWRYRFGPRRHDLRRIAAVVAALCERDAVPVPEWASPSRSGRPITLTQTSFPDTLWNAVIRAESPDACERHNVWFRHVDLDDCRVHGFR